MKVVTVKSGESVYDVCVDDTLYDRIYSIAAAETIARYEKESCRLAERYHTKHAHDIVRHFIKFGNRLKEAVKHGKEA